MLPRRLPPSTPSLPVSSAALPALPGTVVNSRTSSSFITQNIGAAATSTSATNIVGNPTLVVESGVAPHHPGIGQGQSIERKLRRAASEPLVDRRAIEKQRLTEPVPPKLRMPGTPASRPISMRVPDLRFSPVLRRAHEVATQSRLIKKLAPPTAILTLNQHKAIDNYTSCAYASINMRMRRGLDVPEYALIEQGLHLLMQKGYRYDKQTYRGLSANGEKENPVQNLFPEHEIVFERAPVSATYSYEHALWRAQSHGKNGAIVQLIDNPDSNNAKPAVDITRISQHPKEYEVLHPAGKKFEVLLNGYSSKEKIYKIVARNATIPTHHGSVGYVNALLLAEN